MVIGVDRLLAAHLSAEDLNGTVRDDFVSIHIGLGAGAGLPNDEREVVNQLERSHLGGSLLNGFSNLGI